MPDPVPPTTKPPPTVNGAELPPRLLAKLKIEVDGYELLERIGEGGQASVYKALQRKDGATVAIKILHAGPHATDEARARLKRETAALRALNHPNIVHAIAAGRTRSGLDCLVMSYINGRPLDALWEDDAFAAAVTPEPPPPPAARLRLFKQICETVQAAHRKGITHRDLSPSNILIDATGQPHILDFGMASTAFDAIVGRDVTVTGQFIGKLKYASPEQARGANTKGTPHGDVDIRSDVYALGVMLYQLLTNGAFPYEVVGNVIDVLNNIIHSKPRPLSEALSEAGFGPAVSRRPAPASVRRNPALVNEIIEAIVLKALEKEPEARYQSAGELAADIDRYLAGQPTSATIWSKRPILHSKSRPLRRATVAAASIALVATLVGVTMNAKSLAVWLGLATVVAPVLPTERSPIAPSLAQAAMLAAQQPDGSDRRLIAILADLAVVEARLNAVAKQLDSVTGAEPPDVVDDSSGSPSRPSSIQVFLGQVAEMSSEAGRTLEIELPDPQVLAEIEREEANTIARETNADALISRRSDLDARRSALWAQFAWGVVHGREVERLYRFQLADRGSPDARVASLARVVSAGVRMRRTVDLAAQEATASLAEEDEPVTHKRTAEVLTDLAEQTRRSIADFLNVNRESMDADSINDEDRAALESLREMAARLRDALDGAVDAQGRLASEDGEIARVINTARFQRDIFEGTSAAAGFDGRLVAAATDWGMEPDSAAPLPAIRLPRVRPQPAPAVPQEARPTVVAEDALAAWAPGTRWVNRNRAGGVDTWTVRLRTESQIEIERPSVQGRGTVVVQLRIGRSGRLTVTQVRHENTSPVLNRDWNGSGRIAPDSLTLQFSVESKGGNNPWERWSESLELRPE